MSVTTFFLKRHDTLPPLTAELVDADDNPLELAVNGTAVTFLLKNALTDELVLSKACAIVAESPGTVTCTWEAGDTDVAGEYLAEFEIVYPNDGGKLTVPTDGNFSVIILEDYNNL